MISPTAERQLDSFHPSVTQRIISKLDSIRVNPHLRVKRLSGSPFYTLRIGDYRAILDIQINVWRILVVDVGHRKNVYAGGR